MKPNTLILLIGLPRSGKSTYARGHGAPIVNPDSIRLAIHGHAFIGQSEILVWPIAMLMVRALFEAGHCEVILDATNTTKERRKFWKSKSWQVECKEFLTQADVCIARAGESGRFDLVPVIERMAATFEPLEAGEFA